MANEPTQFNALISDALAKRVRVESAEFSVTLGEFATQAFNYFLSLPKNRRREFFDRKNKETSTD